jgi:hypothetical protein
MEHGSYCERVPLLIAVLQASFINKSKLMTVSLIYPLFCQVTLMSHLTHGSDRMWSGCNSSGWGTARRFQLTVNAVSRPPMASESESKSDAQPKWAEALHDRSPFAAWPRRAAWTTWGDFRADRNRSSAGKRRVLAWISSRLALRRLCHECKRDERAGSRERLEPPRGCAAASAGRDDTRAWCRHGHLTCG